MLALPDEGAVLVVTRVSDLPDAGSARIGSDGAAVGLLLVVLHWGLVREVVAVGDRVDERAEAREDVAVIVGQGCRARGAERGGWWTGWRLPRPYSVAATASGVMT
jgi:hypothetical protein